MINKDQPNKTIFSKKKKKKKNTEGSAMYEGRKEIQTW